MSDQQKSPEEEQKPPHATTQNVVGNQANPAKASEDAEKPKAAAKPKDKPAEKPKAAKAEKAEKPEDDLKGPFIGVIRMDDGFSFKSFKTHTEAISIYTPDEQTDEFPGVGIYSKEAKKLYTPSDDSRVRSLTSEEKKSVLETIEGK